eukprot:77994_1
MDSTTKIQVPVPTAPPLSPCLPRFDPLTSLDRTSCVEQPLSLPRGYNNVHAAYPARHCMDTMACNYDRYGATDTFKDITNTANSMHQDIDDTTTVALGG